METSLRKESSCDVPGVPREPTFDGDFTHITGKVKDLMLLDYTFLLLSLVIPTLIGFYQAWRTQFEMEINEFLMASRSMNYVAVGLSLMASFLSGITMMGGPVEVYNHNTMHVWTGVGFIFVCGLSAQVYIPVFYQLRLNSAYEYLEMRFSRAVRTVGFCVFALHMVIYISIVLYVPSLALTTVTGLDMWGAVVSVTGVCTLYVTLGGIKGVIWTDAFQMILMFLSQLAALIQASITVGTKNMVESAVRTKRSVFFDFRLDHTLRNTAWSTFFGGGGAFLALYAVNQAQVHRCLTCRRLREAKLAVWMSFPGHLVFLSLSLSIGLYMGAFYENCDPVTSKLVKHPNELTPLFMQDIFSDTPGMMGLYLAGVISATLSTVSSGLNSIAMVFIEDYIRVYFKSRIREDKERLLSQVIAVIFAIICLETAFLTSKMGGGVLQVGMAMHGGLSGPLLGVFSLGMFFPWANEKGALVGVLGSIFLNFATTMAPLAPNHDVPVKCVSNCNITAFPNISHIALQQPRATAAPENPGSSNTIYGISYLWLSPLSAVSCVLIGILVSCATGFRKPTDVDPRLIVPLLDVLFPFYYLPESMREYYRFGLDHEDKYEKALIKMKSASISPSLKTTSRAGSYVPSTGSSMVPSGAPSTVVKEVTFIISDVEETTL